MSIKAFAIAAGQNTGGRNDATGAFLPGAQKFGAAYNCPWRQFDNIGANRDVRKRFFDTIKTYCPGGINLFAYFGHGIPAGLASAHVYGDHLEDFVKILLPKITKPFMAVLYACSSGSPQGFTSKLRSKLGGDVWVYGHTTVGHSFNNPDVSEEASGNSPTFALLYGSGTELRGPWAEALKYTDLWLRFPWMEDDDIDAEVNARRLLGNWEVKNSAGVQRYLFETVYETWHLKSGRDIADTPSGTVKAVDAKNHALNQGEWEITNELSIDWESGTNEIWPLPLRIVGQKGRSDNGEITARRTSHPSTFGKLQG